MSSTDEFRRLQSRMICFDGGGTKGLISLQILLELEKRLSRPLSYYFDWLVGTSTGSIISALISLGYTLKAIQIIYYAFKDRVMVGTRPYNSDLLEHILSSIVGPNVRMCDVRKKLLITATLGDRSPFQLYLFRSFPSPEDILVSETNHEKINSDTRIPMNAVDALKDPVQKDSSKSDTKSESFLDTATESIKSLPDSIKSDQIKMNSIELDHITSETGRIGQIKSNHTKASAEKLWEKTWVSSDLYYKDLNNANPLIIIRKVNEIIREVEKGFKAGLIKESISTAQPKTISKIKDARLLTETIEKADKNEPPGKSPRNCKI